MSIPLVGEPGRTPFDRTFFNVRLEQLIDKAGDSGNTRVELYLSDGHRLGLCHIEELGDEYLVARTYGETASCDRALQVIPYTLIYRVEVDPTGGVEPRMGFLRAKRAP